MKQITIVICLLLLTLGSVLFAQEAIVGIVDDGTTPLSFVNIGVIGQGIGTVSDIDGRFSLKIPSGHESDTLRLSMIGYETLDVIVKDLAKFKVDDAYQFSLKEKTFDLKEVVVTDHVWKTKILGNTTSSTMMTGAFTSNDLGSEVGIPINIRKRSTFIDEFNVFIAHSEYDEFFFRVNVYELNDKQVGENILTEAIMVTTKIKSGWLTIDLRPYSVMVEDDFLITLEWVKDLGIEATKGLNFSATPSLKGMYFKDASQGSWQRLRGFGLGFNVEVRY